MDKNNYQFLANKKALMLPLAKQELYVNIYKHIKKVTHFNDSQMFKNFPDVCEKVLEEELKNVTIGCNTYRRKFIFKQKE